MSLKKKILLVEDEPIYQKLYMSALSEHGFNVVAASDGEEGLKLLRKEKPDLVMLDLLMPVKNGFQFLETIRADKVFKDTFVIVTTNLSQESDLNLCKKYHVLDYLVKTDWSMEDIIKKIDGYLNK